MKKLSYFLMVGLAFTVLQVSTVAAQMGDPNMAPGTSASGMPPMGDPNMAPPTGTPGMPPMGAPVLTIDDPKCDGSDGPPRTDCPNYVQLDCANAGSPTEVAACWDGIANAKGAPGMPPTMGAPHMPPGAPGMPPTMGAPGMHGDTAALRACKQIKPRGNKGKLRNKKNCFRDLAKSLGANKSARAEWKRCKQIRPKGKLGKLRNKKNCFRDLARSLQHGPPTGAPGMPPMMGAPGMPPGAPGITGKRPGGKMGNYGCGQPNRRQHVNCLRRLLDTTPHAATVRKGKKGMGMYGCHDQKRRNLV